MNFHSYLTQFDVIFQTFRREIIRAERERGIPRHRIVYEYLLKQLHENYEVERSPAYKKEKARIYNGAVVEAMWIEAKRPYYAVYPGIIKYLTKVDLAKVPAEKLSLPCGQLVIRFPEKDNSVLLHLKSGLGAGSDFPIRTLLVADRECSEGPDVKGLLLGLQWADNAGTVFNSWTSIILAKGKSLHDCLELLSSEWEFGDVELESFKRILRIVATLCLLSTDLEDKIILPEVLKADEEKWAQTHDPKYIETAKRNQKFGWSVGKEIFVSPHWRGPCPLALYWTGPGRTIPILRYRAGSIVHKEIAKKVPTGTEEI